jgi:eukaryotic translation initiation factor 2C
MADEKEILLGDFPLRPEVGSKGKKVKLRTNFYEVTSFPSNNIYHYDVEFIPEIPIRIQTQIFDRALEENKDAFEGQMVAYDGRKNVYLREEAEWQEKELSIHVGGKAQRTWKIVIRKAGVASMEQLRAYCDGNTKDKPMDAIQALDIIMRQHPSRNLLPVGRSFYTGDDPKVIDGGCEVWIGYQQSIRPAQGRLLLNVDIAATAFISQQPLMDVINTCLRKPIEEMAKRRENLRRDDIAKINKKIKNLRVVVNHSNSNRGYPVNELSKETAHTKKFQMEDGRSISVFDYFLEKYNVRIQFADLPLVKVGPRKKDILMPMELCEVMRGQRLTKKLTPKQTADMIKITAQKPNVRAKSIEEGVRNLLDPKDPYANHFGIHVDKKMLEVEGRILNAPTILYNKNCRESEIVPRQGSWMPKRATYYRAATLERWGIVCCDQKKFMSDRDIGAFVSTFGKMAKEMGLNITDGKPPLQYCNTRRDGDIENTIKNIYQQIGDPQLLIFILPRQDSAVYGEIKRVCDTVVDVPSQCMLSKHIKKKQPMYCKNVLLKVNVKLGGCNSILKRNPVLKFFMSVPAIIFGADVTHAAPRSTLPSIAALVGSMDAFGYRFATSIRAQTSRTEIIEDLEAMVKELLIGFYRSTKKKPEKIMFYRDGVSEGQFQHVRDFEITAIRAACQSLEEDYVPAITFVVVQKRHHARFFPIDKSAGDKSGNVQAGTVVDTGVVHPFEYDFYLNSHAGLQGTSRPCHYHVLWDENNFSPDLLQNFTYQQCYMYARCTKSVSLVPAAYYAHLVAYRARFHARGDIYADEDSVVSGQSQRSEIEFAKVGPKTRSAMYFM